jgi:hypothetical protein
MCEVEKLLKSFESYPPTAVSEIAMASCLLREGWLVRFVEALPLEPSGRGGYALCPKCSAIISWWIYPDCIVFTAGLINKSVEETFKEDLKNFEKFEY